MLYALHCEIVLQAKVSIFLPDIWQTKVSKGRVCYHGSTPSSLIAQTSFHQSSVFAWDLNLFQTSWIIWLSQASTLSQAKADFWLRYWRGTIERGKTRTNLPQNIDFCSELWFTLNMPPKWYNKYFRTEINGPGQLDSIDGQSLP